MGKRRHAHVTRTFVIELDIPVQGTLGAACIPNLAMKELLQRGKTKKYCNYIDMGMLNEQYAVKETLKTASILQDVNKQD